MAAAPTGATGCPRPPPWCARCSCVAIRPLAEPPRHLVWKPCWPFGQIDFGVAPACSVPHRPISAVGFAQQQCRIAPLMTGRGCTVKPHRMSLSSAGGCSAGPQRRGEPGGRHGGAGPGGGPAGAAEPPALGLRVSRAVPALPLCPQSLSFLVPCFLLNLIVLPSLTLECSVLHVLSLATMV